MADRAFPLITDVVTWCGNHEIVCETVTSTAIVAIGIALGTFLMVRAMLHTGTRR